MRPGLAVVWPHGVGLVVLDEIDSTNEEARRRALAGAETPLWIRARRQVAGRGRQGRVWTEGDGNLYATLLMRPGMPASGSALLSFAACIAVAEFFEAHGGRAALKWPNDPLLGCGKAAGVLLESAGRAGKLDWLAIGVGVNLVSAPAADGASSHPPTSLLEEAGVRVSAEDALTSIAARLAYWASLLAAEGFAPIREAWLARAARLGERIEARTPRENVTGVFEDVDVEGALVLGTANGRRRIHAADIYFR
ncbi:biotin--[acetyl-CoA-carboxylase] ligase [Pikeienuella piscinae]|uniref:biotin--[biotin carboxyl-carrier protein] ligase n=1 Tax=Pikeienuella piscinae TaxID=2748098 RepID=A0A7L5BSH5_9RHOB|nr:biotin--[acetyl-CoA-carboxylase] ligase [Pikeienuella piscinae]QIE54250.1 biotin--[acetyl-CoA-carboxylase] ligase [Pikeienuella piscinae]